MELQKPNYGPEARCSSWLRWDVDTHTRGKEGENTACENVPFARAQPRLFGHVWHSKGVEETFMKLVDPQSASYDHNITCKWREDTVRSWTVTRDEANNLRNVADDQWSISFYREKQRASQLRNQVLKDLPKTTENNAERLCGKVLNLKTNLSVGPHPEEGRNKEPKRCAVK